MGQPVRPRLSVQLRVADLTMIVPGSSVSISTAKSEGAILQVIKDWATNYPAELVAFKEQMRRLRDGLAHDGGHGHARGMSRGGTQLAKGEVPVTLHYMMQRRIDKDWLWNHELRNKFWRLFPIGCLNERSEMQR